MNTNENLKRQRELASLLLAESQPTGLAAVGVELARLVTELDQHLSNDGDYPEDWLCKDEDKPPEPSPWCEGGQ